MTTPATNVPILLMERDGYEIETVLVGPHAKYTAWLLLCRRPSGRISPTATGWAEGHENARVAAYAAYQQRKGATT